MKKTDYVIRFADVGAACFVGYYALTKFMPHMALTSPNGGGGGGSSTTNRGGASTSGGFQNNSSSSNYAPVVTNPGQHVDNTAVEVGAAASIATVALGLFGGGDDDE